MDNSCWTIGVDLGGTKVEVARVGADGRLQERLRRPTAVQDGPDAVEQEIVTAVAELRQAAHTAPAGVGVGIAGQVAPDSGVVRFAPNLDWHDVPLQADLHQALKLPVVVTNDVRAITLGEWEQGAGQGCDDLICLFIGTGIGGGIVSGGNLLSGCTNTAGELGHITVDMHGPRCHCGRRGCLEAFAGGWAIAALARDRLELDPESGLALLELADGNVAAISAKIVVQAAHEGDPFAQEVLETAVQGLIAGTVNLVNAFNPCRLILGGGVMDGLPEWVERVAQGIRENALPAASANLEVIAAALGDDAGVIGAAALARHTFTKS